MLFDKFNKLAFFLLPILIWQSATVQSEEIPAETNEEIANDHEADGLPLIGGTLTAGLGVTSRTAVYRGADDELELEPAFIYRNGGFHLQAYDGINISYDLIAGRNHSVYVLGELIQEGFETSDSRYLHGMDEPELVFAGGIGGLYRTDFVDIELQVLTDASGRHDGQLAEITIRHTFSLFHAEVTPKLSLSSMSDRAVAYYYGVAEREARPDRQAYAPDEAFNFGAELTILYPLTPTLYLIGIVDNTWLDSTVGNSPIVDRDTEFRATIGLLYSF